MMSSLVGSAVSTVTLLTQGANSKLKNMTTTNMSQSQPNVSTSLTSTTTSAKQSWSSDQRKHSDVLPQNGYIPYQSEYCTTVAPAQRIPSVSVTDVTDLGSRPATATGNYSTDLPEMPDLSHLPEEERKLIEAVMKRQEAEESEEKNLIE